MQPAAGCAFVYSWHPSTKHAAVPHASACQAGVLSTPVSTDAGPCSSKDRLRLHAASRAPPGLDKNPTKRLKALYAMMAQESATRSALATALAQQVRPACSCTCTTGEGVAPHAGVSVVAVSSLAQLP